MRSVTRHAAVIAVLSSPDYAVPPVPPAGPPGGMDWLRATASRFSDGPAHRRRRALATTALQRLDPPALARAAYRLASAGVDPRQVPVAVLAAALGARTPGGGTVPDGRGGPDPQGGTGPDGRGGPDPQGGTVPELDDGLAAAVQAVARVYHPDPGGEPADDAVAHLVDAFGGRADEATAATIGLLIQAQPATAGLIDNALAATRRWGLTGPPGDVIAETLRHDPPVRLTRRVLRGAGTPVLLDLATANRDPAVFAEPDRFDPGRCERDRHLTFGAGPRACPGQAHATAIATAVLSAAR